jgi:hypothetical protein
MRPIVSVSLKNGAIAGVLGAILVVVLYYIGRHPFIIPVFLDFRMVLFGIFLFFTLKEIRDYHQAGVLYLWQGIISSFLFVATFALIASTLIAVFAMINPDFLTSYIQLSIQQLKSLPKETIEQVGKKIYERNLELLPSTNTFDLASLYFWQSFMIGLFVSIILSVILRKQPKTL